MFLFYDFYFGFYSLNVSKFIIQQNIFVFTVSYFFKKIFIQILCSFYAHYYHLLKTNTSLASILQIL